MGNLKVADLGKRFFVVILPLIRLFLWFAADVFFYIAERFFRRRIWEIAGTKDFGRSWERLVTRFKKKGSDIGMDFDGPSGIPLLEK